MHEKLTNKSFFHAGRIRGANDIEFDREIVGQELDRIGAVGDDAADLRHVRPEN
jgi:hypothetical protein